MPWLSDNRENKKQARDRVFNCQPKRSVLLLPGFRCECVQLAINNGIITEDTVCTFVERDAETFCQIKQWVHDHWSLSVPPIIHHGELSSLQMYPIDLGYIDLFGNLTKVEVEWIQNQLIPNLMPGSDLAFTFSVPLRGNDFMRRALATMNTKYTQLFQVKLKALNIKGEAKQVAALYAILFERMFADYKYDIGFWTYRDRGPFTMMLVIINNIIKNPEILMREYHERRKGIGSATA
jgi:hypothetical protein